MPSTRTLTSLMMALCAGSAAQAQDAASCQEHKLFGDERRFECSVETKAGAKAPQFVALFSGGHDDTMASLKLQANGADAACGAGSKAELMGEYGNISLQCQLPVAGLAPGRHEFTVHVRWTHAEYTGFRLEP